MVFFKPVTDDEGNVTYVEVEQAEIVSELVTEDIITGSEAYQALLKESIDRRKKIKELKTSLETVVPADESDDDSAPPKDKEPIAPVLNKDELFAEFTAKLAEKQAQEQQAIAERQAMLNRVSEKYKVPAVLLRGNTEAELTEHANQIADVTNNFKTVGANPTPTEYTEDFWTALDKKSSWGSAN